MATPEVALQRVQAGQVPVPTWTDEDKKLIKETVAKGTTDSEFKLFLYTAMKYALDPLVKQVWCVKYDEKAPAAIFTGRDGFLSIAHRSGQFDGMETEAIREGGKLIGARCKVWRKDMSHPFVVEVPLGEYNTGKSNWAKMPETMIKKVAESQALRRAFDISGIYAPEEIDTEQLSPPNGGNGESQTKRAGRGSTATAEVKTDAKAATMAYVREWAQAAGVDPEEAVQAAEAFLRSRYKEVYDHLKPADWEKIHKAREKLVEALCAGAEWLGSKAGKGGDA